MKELVQVQGVRKYRADDFLTMQSVYLRLFEDFYKQYGNFIYYGCTLSNGTITPGVVILDGKACPFTGASGVTGAYYVRQVSLQEDVEYKIGQKPGFITYFAESVAAGDAGAFRLDNAKRFEDVFTPKKTVDADTVDGKHAADFATKEQGATADSALQPSGNGSNLTATFAQAASRVNISSGEKLSILFGKVMKWFADLSAVAFTGKYSDLAGTPKSYGETGANTDGYMTQKSATDLYNGLQVGGTNFIVGTKTIEDASGKYTPIQLSDYFLEHARSGDKCTLNFRATTTGITTVGRCELWIRLADYQGGYQEIHVKFDPKGTYCNKLFSIPFTLPAGGWSRIDNALFICLGANAPLHVNYLMLQAGNTPADWSPAPEDERNYSDNINLYRYSQVQLMAEGDVKWTGIGSGLGLSFYNFTCRSVDRRLASAGEFQIYMPANGTVIQDLFGGASITVANGNIPLPGYSSLIYRHNTAGSGTIYYLSNTSLGTNKENDILLAVVAPAGYIVKLGTGDTIGRGNYISNGVLIQPTDQESGTWNPVAATPGVVTHSQYCYWHRIGNRIFISGQIWFVGGVLPSLFYIHGLPRIPVKIENIAATNSVVTGIICNTQPDGLLEVSTKPSGSMYINGSYEILN